jgi:general secretion pathway protein C
VKNWLKGGAWSALIDLALIAALGVVLAHWTWAALAPRAVAAPQLAPEVDARGASGIATRYLFGATQGAGAGNPKAVSAARLKLLGVVSIGGTGEGRAIVAVESGKAAVAAVGESVAASVILKEVHPDHVVLSRNGVSERIDLERRATAEPRPGAPRNDSR